MITLSDLPAGTIAAVVASTDLNTHTVVVFALHNMCLYGVVAEL
ncbi:hypothetical protein [Paracoccus sp. JM45]|nr:hypothetical protein [Paracoccus sp. JM45]